MSYPIHLKPVMEGKFYPESLQIIDFPKEITIKELWKYMRTQKEIEQKLRTGEKMLLPMSAYYMANMLNKKPYTCETGIKPKKEKESTND